MRKTMLRLALATTAVTASLAMGLPAPAIAAPATHAAVSVTTAAPQAGGDWGWRHHRRFGRFGFPFFGGFPGFFGGGFGFDGFGFGGGCVLIGATIVCPAF